MSKRAIIGYWLLILLPTALISGYAWHMLDKTGERLETTARETVQQHIRTIAEGIQLAVSGVQEELLTSLRQLPPENPLRELERWRDTNPLVRNIFIWSPPDMLHYPPEPPAATAEEQHFQTRYEGLFSGRIPWIAASRGLRPETPQYQLPAASARADRTADEVPGLKSPGPKASERQKVIRLARSSRKSSAAPSFDSAMPQGGWIPWFTENQLHLLGWTRSPAHGTIYGLELELIALLSRLLPDLSADFIETGTLILRDGQGRVWHQVGGTPPEELPPSPAFAVSLSPALPHWQIVWYADSTGLGSGASRRGIQLMGGILLALFCAAVLLGTLLLTLHARRQWANARKKTTFVSNVSHELKTPLTSIRMYAELLESRRVTDRGKQQRYLDIIAKESRRLTRLVENVLDFARLEQGRKRYRMQPLALAPFIDECISAQSLRLAEAGFAVHSPPPESPVYVRADRDALKQIFLNLIDNSMKYAPQGHRLDLTVEQEGSLVIIRFRDYGPGIPPAQQHKIFDKFHRSDTSLTTRTPGSGLGLSIARGLARGMGGDVTYDPDILDGSCFKVILDRAEGKTA